METLVHKHEHDYREFAPKVMGFQSYELLAGNSDYRKSQQAAFIDGVIHNPELDYPLLDSRLLDEGIRSLEAYLSTIDHTPDDLVRDTLWDSASYRMAEMYWLKEAGRLNRLAETMPESGEFLKSARRYQEANEQLYGKPEGAIVEQVYGEVIAQANEKRLHPTGAKIYQEFIHGTTINLADEEITVPGIGESHETRLPQNITERLAGLREYLREEFGDTFDLVNNYWDNLEPDSEGNRQLTIGDMKHLFERVHELYDPNNESGISIVIHPGSGQLAWDTPSMSVRIGESRASITSPIDMVAKIIHEYGVHGLRAVRGLKTDLPMLGTGVFSDAEDAERSDYLTFEEGFASLCEVAIDDSFRKWKPLHVSRYVALASAYEGGDFRQAFERNWRARVIMAVGDNEPVTQKMIGREKKQAYLSVLRIMRGTPTRRKSGSILTFNKDLAYLNGKLDVLRYIDTHGDETDAYRRLFGGKFDPNNRIQNAIARRYAEAK